MARTTSTAVAAGLATIGASMLAATASTSTEGVDKLTYEAPRTGMYRITTCIRIATASTAATSHVVASQVAYTRGAAVSAADIEPTPVLAGITDPSAKVSNATVNQMQVITADAGTTITITVLHTVNGTGTGTYDLFFAIEVL